MFNSMRHTYGICQDWPFTVLFTCRNTSPLRKKKQREKKEEEEDSDYSENEKKLQRSASRQGTPKPFQSISVSV